jgi:membrane protease YdiL (CAAX protease family)
MPSMPAPLPSPQWGPPVAEQAGLPADAPTWMPPLPAVPVDLDPGGRLLSTRALVIVVMAVLLGGALQIAVRVLARDHSITQDTLNNAGIVMTLSLYAFVAVLIVSQITPSVRLRWGDGALIKRLGIGAMVGLGLSGVLLALLSAAVGHLDPDPRIVQLMSDGDPTHIVVMAALTVVAAPLVEETLFRGLLLEALRPWSLQGAVIVSAAFFAVWHFLLASLVYYLAMGIGLGLLYLKRGLASSMAAHACFNGVVTVAAIFVVLGPAHTFHVDGLALTAPGGWSLQNSDGQSDEAGALLLQGPDGAGVFLTAIPSDAPFDPGQAALRLQTESLPLPTAAAIDQSTVRQVDLPTVGRAVEADVAVGADHGTLALFSAGGRDYVSVFVNSGSTKAQADFAKMLDSLRPD